MHQGLLHVLRQGRRLVHTCPHPNPPPQAGEGAHRVRGAASRSVVIFLLLAMAAVPSARVRPFRDDAGERVEAVGQRRRPWAAGSAAT